MCLSNHVHSSEFDKKRVTVTRKRIEKEEKEKDSRWEEDKAKHKWIGLLRCINYAPLSIGKLVYAMGTEEEGKDCVVV